MTERVGLDLLVYHDMTDYTGADLSVGADAAAVLGELFVGYRIVAVGPAINRGKDKTVVLAFSNQPMAEIQALLDKNRPT